VEVVEEVIPPKMRKVADGVCIGLSAATHQKELARRMQSAKGREFVALLKYSADRTTFASHYCSTAWPPTERSVSICSPCLLLKANLQRSALKASRKRAENVTKTVEEMEPSIMSTNDKFLTDREAEIKRKVANARKKKLSSEKAKAEKRAARAEARAKAKENSNDPPEVINACRNLRLGLLSMIDKQKNPICKWNACADCTPAVRFANPTELVEHVNEHLQPLGTEQSKKEPSQRAFLPAFTRR